MTDPSHADLQRSLGYLEGTSRALENRMAGLEKIVSEGFANIEKKIGEVLSADNVASEKTDQRIRSIEDRDQERKGAWKVIVAVAGAVGGAAGLIVPIVAGWVF